MVETAADRVALVADFGRSATWTKSDSSTATVMVLVEGKHQLSAGFELNGTELITTDYIIEGSEESLGNVIPNETITIGSTIYRVVAVLPDGQGWVELVTEKL